MPTSTGATQRLIEVDGSELSPGVDALLESAVVVDRLRMPDMFSLVFRDRERDVLSRAGLKIGAKVAISTTSVSEETPRPLIEGEVTSIETDYDRLGTRAVVRGYDLSHRLTAGRNSRVYVQKKLSEVAQELASGAGLQADVDDTPGVVEHLTQVNVSDLDFLYELGRRAGFDCRVEGETLLFKKPVDSSAGPAAGDFTSDDPLQLVWDHNLIEFRARMSAVAQVAEVQVRGWSVADKEAIVGSAKPTASGTKLKEKMTPPDLAAAVGGKKMVVVDHPVGAQEEADALAAARAEQVGSAAFEATAVALGNAALKAGAAVHIAGVDPALEGRWVITGSRHEFGGPDGYQTFLEFTGRQDRSIHGLLAQPAARSGTDRIYGVVTAIVTDNADPEDLGRVRLRFPWLHDDVVSRWARVMGPGAGKDYGIVWIPQVDDEVLVAFEHGDVNRPLVIGGLWNGQDRIPFDSSGLDHGKVTYCGFTSRTGHKISFFESSGESRIHLLTKGGAVSVILDEQNKEVKVETTGKIVFDAQGDVEIKAGGALKLEANGQVTVKGATVALN